MFPLCSLGPMFNLGLRLGLGVMVGGVNIGGLPFSNLRFRVSSLTWGPPGPGDPLSPGNPAGP